MVGEGIIISHRPREFFHPLTREKVVTPMNVLKKRKLQWMGIIFASSLLLLAALLIPPHIARADVGPKPTMSFDFIFENGLSSLTIIEGKLMQCSDATCLDAKPLQMAGPQHFSCQQKSCESMAYGYSEHNRVEITFSDGKTRQSNIFGKKYFGAHYHVNVRQNDLLVEEQRGGINPLIAMFIGIIGVGMLGLGQVVVLLVVLALLVTRARQDKANFEQSRGLFITVWVLATPIIALGSLLSLSILATVAIEAVLALIYAQIKKHSKLTMFTMVLLANLVTQVGLLYSIQAMQSGFSVAVTGLVEIGIWFVESLILYGTQLKSISIKEAMMISLILNGVSFWVGLLLRL